jgi:hypothetical protein
MYIHTHTHTSAIRKVTSDELLTKQAMRKKSIYYIQKICTYLSYWGTEALVALGNKFLHACVKELCHLWAQPRFDTFHQLLITVEVLWSQPALRIGKQAVVTLSKIRAVRRVVKQLQLKCSSSAWVQAGVCRHTLSWRSTTMDVSIPRLFFWTALHSFLVFGNTKYGWVHKQQTSLTKAHKNLFHDMTSASILAMTMLRSILSMYVLSCGGVLRVAYKTGFGLDDWINWHLVHTTQDYRQCSAITNLHTLQFTITHTLGLH